MNNKTNSITAKINDYRYIGKAQLNADDMGGVGCSTWDEYLKVCNVLTIAAWEHTMGVSTDDNMINAAIAGLFDFFGIEVIDSQKYTARILAMLVERKPYRSDELKDALKDKRDAKKAYDAAVLAEKPADEIAPLKDALDTITATVEALYAQPKHYYFQPTPMFDKKTKKAKASARKAIEDTCSDIFQERKFMSADELQKEAQALADQRKGRKMRKKEEAKQADTTTK